MNNNANQLFVIDKGPFAGTHVPETEVLTKTDQLTGAEFHQWPTVARTRHFLDVFPPKDGWSVVIRHEPMDLMMDDTTVQPREGVYVQNPAWLLTATLVDKERNAVASASVVQLINCPLAFEIGETRARGKLYQALGLPGVLDVSEDSLHEASRSAPAEQKAKDVASSIIPIVDVPREPEPTVASHAATEPEQDTCKHEEVVTESGDASKQPTVVAEHDVDVEPELESVAVALPHPAMTAPTKRPPGNIAAERSAGAIPDSLMRQIVIRAERQKIDLPNLQTLAQAQAFLAQLVSPSRAVDLASGAVQ